MSTPLQRLVERARGADNSHALRIEPLLGPRFAAPTTSGVGLRESATEVVAATRVLARNTQAEPASSVPRALEVRLAMPDDIRIAAARSPEDAPRTAPQAQVSHRDDSHVERPARSLLDRAVDETPRETRADVTVVALGSGVSPARTAPTDDMDGVSVAPAQQESPMVMSKESPASITLSIGHVEVHSAPAPTPATPRRQAFRPGVSLDAFLQRGKGDRR